MAGLLTILKVNSRKVLNYVRYLLSMEAPNDRLSWVEVMEAEEKFSLLSNSPNEAQKTFLNTLEDKIRKMDPNYGAKVVTLLQGDNNKSFEGEKLNIGVCIKKEEVSDSEDDDTRLKEDYDLLEDELLRELETDRKCNIKQELKEEQVEIKQEEPKKEIMQEESAGASTSVQVEENHPPEYNRKRTRDNSRTYRVRDSSENSTNSTREGRYKKKRPVEIETDETVLARRQKQIDYGRNTVGYDRYITLIPKDQRKREHPKTPPMHVKYSRRAWDGLVKIWRQQLHLWDPEDSDDDSDDDSENYK